jgi:hypothetical protein
MCKNGYTARWDHHKTGKDGVLRDCPNLKISPQQQRRYRYYNHDPSQPKQKQQLEWNEVTVQYAKHRDDHHLSLAHLWNDWYSYYWNDTHPDTDTNDDQKNHLPQQHDKGTTSTTPPHPPSPFVVVRMEDLVFYPEETTRIVCECAGGQIRTDAPFSFIVDSAKADSPGHDKSTGIFAAWVKYAAVQQPPPPRYGLSMLDYDLAQQVLNVELMSALGYQHPPPA